MPSDANGVYSLPAGYLAITGQTIQPSQHNPPLEDIATALTARLSANGANPMTGPFKATDGLVGAPSISFNTAQTTGFYKTAGGNIGVAIAGTEAAEFGPSGIVKGAKFIGELFDFSGLTAPALCVLPFGQTLSRAAYPDLWTFAQAEIAAGNAFYNNGNGTTTFGIGDCRGRVRAGRDNMGGSAASRLTTSFFGANAQTLGAIGGLESHALTTPQLATHSHANSLTDPGHSHTASNGILDTIQNGSGGVAAVWRLNAGGGLSALNSSTTGISISNASAGSGSAHNNVQPTIVFNCALFAGA